MLKIFATVVYLVYISVNHVAVAASDTKNLPLLHPNGTEAGEWPCRYTGSFVQTRTAHDLPNKLRATGQFLYSCKKGLLWEVRKPVQNSRIYTYTEPHFQINRHGRVLVLDTPAEKRTAALLLGFLGGQTDSLAKDFDIVKNAQGQHALILTPRRAAVKKRLLKIEVLQSASSISITIELATGQVSIALSDIEISDLQDQALCQQFSRLSQKTCPVLMTPARFSPAESD